MHFANVARLVLLDARRGGLPWLAAGAVLLCLGLAVFLSQLALTESRELQLATAAALARACAVFLIVAQVAASVHRELDDKGLELMLSLPLSRPVYYLGRLAGFVACAAALAAFFALPLFFWAPPGTVLLWAISLALELALVAAASLFFAISLGRLVPSIAAVIGLYVLARAMAAMRTMADSPIATPGIAHDLARWGVEGVAFLLPRLDAVTRTEWLLYGPPDARAYVLALAGLVIYAALLIAAGLFDFQRASL